MDKVREIQEFLRLSRKELVDCHKLCRHDYQDFWKSQIEISMKLTQLIDMIIDRTPADLVTGYSDELNKEIQDLYEKFL